MQGKQTILKVMTFNIRYGTANDGENSWRYRRGAVLEFLSTYSCDIIAFQELLHEQLMEIQHVAPHLHWVGVGREDGHAEGEYAAILYDSRRIHLLSSGTFWLSDKPELVASTTWGNIQTRICTHAAFGVEGHHFEVYNVHLDHENAYSRLKSVDLIADKIQTSYHSAPTLVTGDFNEGEQGPAIERLQKRGFGDAYRMANPDGPEQATYNDWRYVVNGDKIDYIFVSDEWSVLDSTILRGKPGERLLSDHYPLIATVGL